MILQQTLIFYPVVLSLYISYKVLKITDLSADGVYVLGAAAFAKTLIYGPVLATLSAGLCGMLCGIILAYMQRKNHVHPLICSILLTFMLYSVNFEFMGRPNLSLIGSMNLLKLGLFTHWMGILGMINILLSTLIIIVLSSSTGLLMRAFGTQADLLERYGLNSEKYRIIGLAIGSFCTAISGALFAQIHGFVDLNMGVGVALISIGAIMIGQKLIPSRAYSENYSAFIELLSAFFGVFCYFALLAGLMQYGIEPVHLKFFIGIVLFLSLRLQSLVKTRSISCH
jgi:putative ABC transport system permease protein